MSLVFHLMWTGSRLCSFLLHLSAIKIGPGLERRCLENTGRNNLKSKQLEGVDNNILQSFLEILKQRRQWKNGLTEGPHIHPPTPAPHDGMGSCRHSDMELLFRKRTCSSILCGKLLSASHTLHDLHASRVPYVTGVSSGAPGIHKWGGVLKLTRRVDGVWTRRMTRCSFGTGVQAPIMSAYPVHQSQGIRRAKWVS